MYTLYFPSFEHYALYKITMRNVYRKYFLVSALGS